MTKIETSLSDRRRHSRIELFDLPRAAIAETDNNLAVQAQILDISLGGARARINRALDPLQKTVEVVIEGVKTIAEIVWQSATEIGLRYIEQAGDAAVSIFESILNREFSTRISIAN